MNLNIRIPKPCHEDWQQMTPGGKGRHCDQCCKTVVDFTNWANEDILRYLQKHSSQKVCGRFNTAQLNNAPVADKEQFIYSVTHAPLPFIKKIAAVILFAFGLVQMSCNTPAEQQHNIVGAMVIPPITIDSPLLGKPIIQPDTLKEDKHRSIKHTKLNPNTIGLVANTPDTLVTSSSPDIEIMGDIEPIQHPIPDTPKVIGK